MRRPAFAAGQRTGRLCLYWHTLLMMVITANSLFCQTGYQVLHSGQTGTTAGRSKIEAPEIGPAYYGRQTVTAPLGISGPGVVAASRSGKLYVAVSDGIFWLSESTMPVRVAGIEGDSRYSGDGGPAIHAGMNPRGVVVDAAGDIYLADTANNRVRKIAASTGMITTVAGNGVRGFSGDGGPATSAELDGPTGVTLDNQGNLYVVDGARRGRNRIRKVGAATGVITTVAGTGVQGYSGDGGPALSAQFNSLGGLATDTSGNLYIADNYNNRIRMISATSGIITTVAGGTRADALADTDRATNAQLNNPLSVAIDTEDNIYIADSGNYRIRKVTNATGTIHTIWKADAAYRNALGTFPCAIALDAAGALYVAESGISQIRKLPAGAASLSEAADDAVAIPSWRSHGSSSNFQINVTYDTSVPAAARTAFNSLVSTYQSVFASNVVVNISVFFGATGLGQSSTEQIVVSYSDWRAAMIANATANSGNTYAVAAAASLPAEDPIGNGIVVLNTANARALGFTANTSVDSTLTFSNVASFEYNGVPASGAADFMDVAAHELDEGLGIGSALTGLANNASIPTGDYAVEDYFRYSGPGTRDITTSPTAVVYFSYDGGNTNVAQFNQAYSALGASGLDRNDWVYGNSGCPAAIVHIQDAIFCYDQAVAVGVGPEITVLNTLGYNPFAAQTITFGTLPDVTFGIPPFSLTATATSGLAVIFTSTTTGICTVSGNMLTVIAAGMCSITASQPGDGTYFPAPPVTRSFTIGQATQTISFGALGNVTLPVAPFAISATASSNLAVSFASITTGVCTVSQSMVTVLATGLCSIKATQSGDSNYTAAMPVTQSFTVLMPGCTLSLNSTSFSSSALGGDSMVGLTASPGNCSWTASSNASWLEIVSYTGIGDGTVTYSIATNTGSARAGTLTIAGQTFTVNQAAAAVSPLSVIPGSGSNSTQSFTFTFEDPNGYADLAVVNVLINDFLNGIGACYVAFAPTSATSGSLYLVDDAGDGGYVNGSPIALPSSGTLHNSQCTISGTGSSVSASGNALTLTLAVTFASGFAGNRIVYSAARSNSQNSGWQALGTWNVPGSASTSDPAVGGVNPGHSAATGQTYTFNFTDTNGYGDLAVVDVLINNFLDGVGACYVAFVPTGPSSGYLYLVDDAGDGGYSSGSPIALPSSSTLQNSQCTISGTGSTVVASGNTLTLNLALTFTPGFVGNQVIYLAARNNSAGNSGWQAVGSVTVP